MTLPASIPAPSPCRVVVLDDHPVVAEGWGRIIRDRMDCEVIPVASPLAAFRAWRHEAPDAMVVDLTIGEQKIAGIRLIARLRQVGARLPILVFTMHRSPIIARRALQAGCNGLINKDSPSSEIADAFIEVVRGGSYVSTEMARKIALMNQPGTFSARPRLTPREEHILRGVAEGLSYREIAERAGISYKTVSNVSMTLKDKLGATTFADMVGKAIRYFDEL
ncbi:response regulator transcription factor [Paracoccus aminophilus]|uniref:Two-component response regulator n=1 Tax=Paracoccus aminophilus JCM 7686 TaxID=1367847 RepID=S5YSN1_PARAH|nr:response regulator transcription factor [Paracoccus aminophilus]AGT08241.1 two-component response regulator [Paracoccus aminophilus JCM 7686]